MALRWFSCLNFREGKVSAPVRIQFEDFSVDAELRALRDVSLRIGGIASFVGCARDFSEGRNVSEITFEAYTRMVIPEMEALRSEAIERFSLIEARLVHRLGTVRSGDNIVFIAAAAEHRGPAFEACRWLIDSLKERVPIWKKEMTPEGENWVTPHP